MTALLTYSSMSSTVCFRRYYWQYIRGIVPIKKGEALSIGTIFHDCLEKQAIVPDPGYPMWAQTDDDFLKHEVMYAIASGMAEAYLKYWEDDIVKYVSREESFEFPIRNPETNGVSRNFRAAGKIDGIVLHKGRTCVMEHKTVGVDVSATSDYWRKLALDAQISMYIVGSRANGHDTSNTVIYDVARRPGIKPKLIGKGEDKHRESPEEYKARLLDDYEQRPEYYFARREVTRFPEDLQELEAELWMMQRLLSECKLNGWWPRRTTQCNSQWRCPYLDVCRWDEEGAPDGFEIKTSMHPELTFKEEE